MMSQQLPLRILCDHAGCNQPSVIKIKWCGGCSEYCREHEPKWTALFKKGSVKKQ